MPANSIVTRVPEDMRWTLKRAALDERTTTQQLVTDILGGWLRERGYLPADTRKGEAGREEALAV